MTNAKTRAIGVGVKALTATGRAGRASAAMRVAAIAAAIAFVFAEWTSLHHRAAEAHELCGDHADGPRAIGTASAIDSDGERAADGPALLAAEDTASGGPGDDLCQLCRSWRERIAPPTVGEIPTSQPSAAGGAPARSCCDVPLGIATVAVAPKTSPPA